MNFDVKMYLAILIASISLFVTSSCEKEKHEPVEQIENEVEVIVRNASNSTYVSEFGEVNQFISRLDTFFTTAIDTTLDYCSCDASAMSNLRDALDNGFHLLVPNHTLSHPNYTDEEMIDQIMCSLSYDERLNRIDSIMSDLVDSGFVSSANKELTLDFANEFIEHPGTISFDHYLSSISGNAAERFIVSFPILAIRKTTVTLGKTGILNSDEPEALVWHAISGLAMAAYRFEKRVISDWWNENPERWHDDYGSTLLGEAAEGFGSGAVGSI
jgi:hypothetical protein